MKQWPSDYEAPARTTLRDWIERALKEGLFERFGKGCRTSPYRYALPGKKFDPFGLSNNSPTSKRWIANATGEVAWVNERLLQPPSEPGA